MLENLNPKKKVTQAKELTIGLGGGALLMPSLVLKLPMLSRLKMGRMVLL